MTELEEHIKRVNGKLQQLLKSYQQLKRENAQQNLELKALKQQRENDQVFIAQLEQKVTILKSAAGQLTESEKKSFERNINQYIREIDKCISLLSE